MRLLILLTTLCMMVSQANSGTLHSSFYEEESNWNHLMRLQRDGSDPFVGIKYLHRVFYTDDGFNADESSWLRGRYYASHIARLIKGYPDQFNKEFPNSTVEETEHLIRVLERGHRWLYKEQEFNSTLGNFSLTDKTNEMVFFNSKIKELKEKLETLKKGQEALGNSNKCQKAFS